MKNFIITIDLGGTTFSSYLIDKNLSIVGKADIDLINNYVDLDSLLLGIKNQIRELLENFNVKFDDIMFISISAPGPLNSKTGLILDTPNLKVMQNVNICKILNEKFNLPVYLENDANLFALGEWYLNYKKHDVMVGITLGTGLGLGIIINEKLFNGAHGMGAEYGISMYNGKMWEDAISIDGLEKLTIKKMNEKKSPKILYNLALDGNSEALKIWNIFGKELGVFSSHIVNMIDPSVICFGGGVSKAYTFFSNSLKKELVKYSPSYSHNKILLKSSSNQLNSTHVGAALHALKQNL